MKSILKLFHALLIEQPVKQRKSDIDKQTIPCGFIFSPEVKGCYTDQQLMNFIPLVTHELGLTKEALNATFHKSWDKIRKAELGQLIVEQVLHYITTYGFKEHGIFYKDLIFIPSEKLKIPSIDVKQIKLSVIQGYTEDQIRQKILNLISCGIALKEETITAVIETLDLIKMHDIPIDDVKNKEVRCILCDRLKLIPRHPVEFLRFLIFKVTGKTLLIKNTTTIDAIKNYPKDKSGFKEIWAEYVAKYELKSLATIFYRFKPLFLAFKRGYGLNSQINWMRKLAPLYHVPMKEDYLNTVTKQLKQNNLVKEQFLAEIAKVNNFRKIRLAYALNFRMTYCDSIVYRIRNGTAYAKQFDSRGFNILELRKYYDLLIQNISESIAPKVQGKKFFLDPQINYALPATEKQFTGNIPCGSSVELKTDMIIGVNWNNIEENGIDLDLSLMGGRKFGWDAQYRTESGGDILFSGDITDATEGATEAYFISNKISDHYLLMLNYYNYVDSMPVPFKIFAAYGQKSDLKKDYMVDPNNVQIFIPSLIAAKQMMLGLILTQPTKTIFYIGETQIGKTISAQKKPYLEHARKYLVTSFCNPIRLAEILARAGAVMVSKKGQADIDLSIEALQKDSIIHLLI